MPNKPRIAIVYLLFYPDQSHIDDATEAIKNLSYPRESIEYVIVCNPHPTAGSSAPYIREKVLPRSNVDLPRVTLLEQSTNLGFAEGNNKGVEWAAEHGCEYVYFHNNDAYMAPGCLEPLVAAMEADPKIGAAQSLILLHPETTLVNSTGNSFHYLGFGYCDDYRLPVASLSLPPIKEISYASGAGLFMRMDLLQKYGGWDNDFFLYHEDLEFSFRLRALGYRVVMVRDSVLYHKYQFSKSITKYYWMERNRFGVLLMFFKVPTLLLMLPMMAVLELGLIVFAIKGGWFKERLKVYQYWIKPSSWKLWLGKRKKIFALRTIRDADFLKVAKSTIDFQEASMQNPVLKYVGNPVMTAYWAVIRRVISW